MDKRYIEENEIGLKYLKGQLTNEQLEQFEIYMMDNPDILDDLNVDQLMIKGSSVSHKADSPFKLSFIRSLFGDWRLVNSLASFALGLVAMAMFSIERVSVNSVEIQYLVAQDSVRGSDDSPTVEFEFDKASFSTFSSDQFAVIVDAPSLDVSEYKVEVFSAGESTRKLIKDIESLVVNSESRIVLLLKVSDFKPGDYEVQISRHDRANQESANALFRTSITRG
jgi:hypothetical protein